MYAWGPIKITLDRYLGDGLIHSIHFALDSGQSYKALYNHNLQL